MAHVSAALSGETKRDESSTWAGGAPPPCPVVSSTPPVSDALHFPALGLIALPLPFEDRLAARQSWQTRCIGLSQSGSASPQSPCSRPPHFPRHLWPSGRSGVRVGTKHSSPAAQGIVCIPSVRCVLGCVFSRQQQQQ